MFTGLVTAIGTVREVEARADGGVCLRILSPWVDLALGESIAVDGACLTVEAHAAGQFQVAVVSTTLGRTTLGDRQVGDRVNLERALAVGDRMGGHWVQGHVDGIGTVRDVSAREGTRVVRLTVPDAVAQVSIPLGSITVNGVSLTVHAVPRPGEVELALVPFTLERTTLGALEPGDRVQLEGDLVGKHVQAQLAGRHAPAASR
jgi:riboflavin synthase